MTTLIKILLIISVLLISQTTFAANCTNMQLTEKATQYKGNITYLDKLCAKVNNLSFSETLIVFEPTTALLGNYDVKVLNSSNNISFQSRVNAGGDISIYKVPTNEANSITIEISPLASGVEYSFVLLYEKDASTGSNFIHIIPNIILPSTAYTPPPPPTCNPHTQTCTIPLRTSLSVTEESPQCNDSNRPLTEIPKNKTTNAYLNINKELLKTHNAANSVRQQIAGSANANLLYNAWAASRMYHRHKMGAELDVKSIHSKYDGDAAAGNFLYGAMMEVLGFSLSSTEKFSAAYQAKQNNTSWLLAVPEGIYNYVFNTGDNPGDKQEVAQGWRYAREVWSVNKNSDYASSCISAVAKAAYESGRYGPISPVSSSPSGVFWGGSSFCRETGSVCTGGGCNYWSVIVPCSQL